MMPNKLYGWTGVLGSLYASPRKPEEVNAEEYIRKDALLEWASRLKEKWEEPPMSRHSPGCVYMLEQLINKLNSM